MDKKATANVILNFLGSVVVVPVILNAYQVYWPIIVAVAITCFVVVYLWGHAPNLGWRRRMLPIGVMALGVIVFSLGTLWFYRQSPAKPQTNKDDLQVPAETAKAREESAGAHGAAQTITKEPEITTVFKASPKRAATQPEPSLKMKVIRPVAEPNPQPSLPKVADESFDVGEAQATVRGLWRVWLNRDGLTAEELAGITLPPDDWMNERLANMGRPYRVRARGAQFDIFTPPTRTQK